MMRIGIREGAFEPFAAEYNNETVTLACFDNDFGITSLFDFFGQERA